MKKSELYIPIVKIMSELEESPKFAKKEGSEKRKILIKEIIQKAGLSDDYNNEISSACNSLVEEGFITSVTEGFNLVKKNLEELEKHQFKFKKIDYENAAFFAKSLIEIKDICEESEEFCLNCCWGPSENNIKIVIHRYECHTVTKIIKEPKMGRIRVLDDTTPYNIWFGMFSSLNIATTFAFLVKSYILMTKGENVPVRGHATGKGKNCLELDEKEYVEKIRDE